MPKILLNKSNVDLDYPICRPSLDLDFTQEVLDERITFSRGSIGTRVNRNRLIETVPANQPRFDYDPVTGECKGLLIEESRQNLLLRSEDFTTTWIAFNSSIQSNVITAPDGNTTADKFIEDTTKIGHQLIQDVSLTASTTYTRTIFVKAAEKSRIRIRVADTATFTKSAQADFNITRGVVLTTFSSGVTFVSSSIFPLTNGWYRCSMTYTVDATGGTYRQSFWLLSDDAGTTAYQGDGTSGIYVWGAQLEAGAFPTSYIPTTASTVTRSADNADMTGTNFSSWYNQTEGTLYAAINNITTRSSITFDRFVALVGTDVNRNVISICTQTASGGGAQNKFLAGVSYSPDGSYVVDTFSGAVSGGGGPDRIGKAIIAYKKDNFAFTVNGITPLRDIGGDIPVCNRLLIFGSARFQPAPSGTISRLTYYPRALKPNQLQLLTQ